MKYEIGVWNKAIAHISPRIHSVRTVWLKVACVFRPQNRMDEGSP